MPAILPRRHQFSGIAVAASRVVDGAMIATTQLIIAAARQTLFLYRQRATRDFSLEMIFSDVSLAFYFSIGFAGFHAAGNLS